MITTFVNVFAEIFDRLDGGTGFDIDVAVEQLAKNEIVWNNVTVGDDLVGMRGALDFHAVISTTIVGKFLNGGVFVERFRIATETSAILLTGRIAAMYHKLHDCFVCLCVELLVRDFCADKTVHLSCCGELVAVAKNDQDMGVWETSHLKLDSVEKSFAAAKELMLGDHV